MTGIRAWEMDFGPLCISVDEVSMETHNNPSSLNSQSDKWHNKGIVNVCFLMFSAKNVDKE